MKLLPFVSSGEPFVSSNGTVVESLPMQLLRTKSGMTVLRIGSNTYWFNENGTYDGCEASFPRTVTSAVTDQYVALLEASRANKGHAPATPYFGEGGEGYDAEIRGWPEAERPGRDPSGN